MSQSSQAKRPQAKPVKTHIPTAALVASAKSGHRTNPSTFLMPNSKALGDSLSCTCGQQFTSAGKYLNHSRLCGGVAIRKTPVQPHLLSGSLGSPLGLPTTETASYWREEQRKVLLPKVAMRLPPQSPTAKSMLYCSAKAVALAGSNASSADGLSVTGSYHPSVSGSSIQLMEEDDRISLSDFELNDDPSSSSSSGDRPKTQLFEPCPEEDFGTRPHSCGSSSTGSE